MSAIRIGQKVMIGGGNDAIEGTLDGFQRVEGGTVYEVWVPDDSDVVS